MTRPYHLREVRPSLFSRSRATSLACLLVAACFLTPQLLLGGTIKTIAGTGQEANNGNGGPATKINVGSPFGVEIGPDKNLYITEVGNHRILRLEFSSGKITTVVGTGQQGYSGDGGPVAGR